jgi:hypothetical protein
LISEICCGGASNQPSSPKTSKRSSGVSSIFSRLASVGGAEGVCIFGAIFSGENISDFFSGNFFSCGDCETGAKKSAHLSAFTKPMVRLVFGSKLFFDFKYAS